MADPTPNWGIPQLDNNSAITPIQSPFNTMAMALDNALTSFGFRRGTAAERAAWTSPPAYALFVDTNTGAVWQRRGEAWVVVLQDSGFTNASSFVAGAGAASGQPPRFRMQGERVDLFGALSLTASWSPHNLIQVPTPFRVTSFSGNIFIGTTVTSTGKSVALLYNTADHFIRSAAGYYSTVPATGDTVPLMGSWFRSN